MYERSCACLLSCARVSVGLKTSHCEKRPHSVKQRGSMLDLQVATANVRRFTPPRALIGSAAPDMELAPIASDASQDPIFLSSLMQCGIPVVSVIYQDCVSLYGLEF